MCTRAFRLCSRALAQEYGLSSADCPGKVLRFSPLNVSGRSGSRNYCDDRLYWRWKWRRTFAVLCTHIAQISSSKELIVFLFSSPLIRAVLLLSRRGTLLSTHKLQPWVCFPFDAGSTAFRSQSYSSYPPKHVENVAELVLSCWIHFVYWNCDTTGRLFG